jgi:hypothetical protein
MGVRQDHAVDGRGRKREMAVPLKSLLTVPLIHAAVEKESLAGGSLYMMHGPCDGLRGAPKGKFHKMTKLYYTTSGE